jgi:hypothetical protein
MVTKPTEMLVYPKPIRTPDEWAKLWLEWNIRVQRSHRQNYSHNPPWIDSAGSGIPTIYTRIFTSEQGRGKFTTRLPTVLPVFPDICYEAPLGAQLSSVEYMSRMLRLGVRTCWLQLPAVNASIEGPMHMLQKSPVTLLAGML